MRSFIFKNFSFLLLVFIIQSLAFAQDLNSSTLVKCWDFPTENLSSFNYASDNDQIILPFNDGTIVSLDRFGKIIWKSEIGSDIISNLLLFDEKVFFLELNSKKIFLNAISNKTGINIWKEQINSLLSNQQLQLSTQNNLITVFGLDKEIVLINSNTGELKETIPTEENIVSNYVSDSENFFYYKKNNGLKVISRKGIREISKTNKERKNKSDISQLFDLEKNLLLVSVSGQLFLLEKHTFQVLWKNRIGGSISSVSENEDSVFVSSIDNYIYRFSKKNGNIHWRRRFENKAFSNYSEDKKVLIASLANNNVTAIIDESKGRLVNQITIESDSYFINKPLLINNRVILFHNKGLSSFEFEECSKEKE